MGKPCTGGGRGIGKLGRVWNVKRGVELSWEVIGEGQTRRFFFLDIKVEWLVLCKCRVLNTTFNNISVILWRSVLLVEETRAPGENH